MSNFRQILGEIGEFGLFQRLLLAGLCIPSIFSAFNTVGQVYMGRSFEHHCNTDWILERGPNLTEEKQRNLTLPVKEDGEFESCKMFTPVDLDLETIEAYGINTTIGCIDGWIHEAPSGTSTVVTEFDVVCENSGLIEVSQSLSMVGVLLAALIFGAVSDRFGRRFVILVSLSLVFCFGTGAAFSPNVYVYMVLKIFTGFSGAVITLNTSVLAIEWTAPSKAALCTEIIIIFFSLGLMMMSGIAYLIQNWRILQIVMLSPLVLFVGLFYWFLPESARWLITQGRKEEAQKQLERAARVNRKKIPKELLEELTIESTVKRRSMIDIFRIPYLRKRCIILGFIWFSISLLYYGLTLNVNGFGVDFFLTQFIFGFVEIPANFGALFLIQRFGRKICQASFLIFAGAACLVVLAVPSDLPVVSTIAAVLGKTAATAAFSTLYIYSAELYPTNLRQRGMGLNSMCDRVGGILSPLVRLLDVYHPSIPMLIYGLIPVAAGNCCFLLPESLNVELQDFPEFSEAVNEPKKNGGDTEQIEL